MLWRVGEVDWMYLLIIVWGEISWDGSCFLVLFCFLFFPAVGTGIVDRSLVVALLFFMSFSSTSVAESTLSLLLFRLTETSIFSVFSICCCFLPLFLLSFFW